MHSYHHLLAVFKCIAVLGVVPPRDAGPLQFTLLFLTHFLPSGNCVFEHIDLLLQVVLMHTKAAVRAIGRIANNIATP